MTIDLLLYIFANKFIVKMKNSIWIHPKTVTGSPAEGNTYLRRNYINDEFWLEILKGNHILFAAPRRVGKTSIMKDLVSNPKENFMCIYENVESDNTSRQFYKRIYFLILNRLKAFAKSKKLIEKWSKTLGIEEVSLDGTIKFKDKQPDYKEELLLLIKKLPTLNQRIVLFLDEFPEVISAIRKKEGDDSAIEVLHTLREIRHNKTFDHSTFVLAGSIGLEHVVESLDRLKLINDLHPIKIEPLTRSEAKQLIKLLTKEATMQLAEKETERLLDKLELLIPYFLQLMIEHCDEILYNDSRPDLNIKEIDEAFDRIIRDNKNLNDWEDRLKPPYLHKDEFVFCKSILTSTAHNSISSIQEIFDKSNLLSDTGNYMNLLKMLVRDGYLLEIADGRFRFSSPLLQAWWKKQHPLFEIKK